MLLSKTSLRNVSSLHASLLLQKPKRSYTPSRAHDPLTILFCGSDDFSIASLRALNDEKVRDPQLISSLDVVCRPDKPTGRGLKKLSQCTGTLKLLEKCLLNAVSANCKCCQRSPLATSSNRHFYQMAGKVKKSCSSSWPLTLASPRLPRVYPLTSLSPFRLV